MASLMAVDALLPHSSALARRSNQLIPGGSHTYAKGDDQYPEGLGPIIDHGLGCHIWDADGNEYIEYGMGLRAVGLGHGHPAVVSAARNAMEGGTNFTRPTRLEIEAAEDVLAFVPGADMVKFAKNGSDVTSAAVKLARAYTGRPKVAICGSFLSVDDWFIGATSMHGGIPDAVRDLTVEFEYNRADHLERIFADHPAQISCVIMEGERETLPDKGFLQRVQDLCRENDALFVLDEMIAGMRLAMAGSQEIHQLDPDLSTFGKALANGFAVSALTGKKEIMSLGSLESRDSSRVFLLSTTHGAESHGLAAMRETIRTYRDTGVIEHLYQQGGRLRAGLESITTDLGITEYFEIKGREPNLVYGTKDPDGRPSQEFRTLFLQETIRRGLLIPSLVVSDAHTDEDVDQTLEICSEALVVYAKALTRGVDVYLEGRSVRRVFPTT